MSFIDYGQAAVTECVNGLASGNFTQPFSFILTPKQNDVLEKRFRYLLWPAPQCKAIEVTVKAVQHVFVSRTSKDGLTQQEIAGMMAAIFRKDSEVAVNHRYTHQFHLINSRIKLKDGQFAIGCFQVSYPQGLPTSIALETAYLAVPAKALGLLGKGVKK